ncbi:DNA-binding HxlR family transcriptional regulator [Kineosphaera limosa]|uniref:Putative HxlR family transcriptional regulator n=1 Tax=Kineosphaera limosa NBRC 100340 TaxID=1184609 RepID=K6WE82_9MICO|nr:winged helix-turn-helix transcriptional regulator [Kineosphaera limosa]NYE01155.1 DNA-binding HxlR family transcriptional regulator [Kineosphaera limosa]GAB97610.1 putative HxlR family transcriptional regulator [Kineosphaera limosa NBRC 100340]
MATRPGRSYGHYSGVARAVELVGERWALLIVRDLLVGSRRYGDLKANLPRIPTNILSDRLRELQQAGVIRRVPVVRGGYELTEVGRGLAPAVLALERWGWDLLGSPTDDDTLTADGLVITLTAAFRPAGARGVPPTRYEVAVGDAQAWAVVADGRLLVRPSGPTAVAAPDREIPRVPSDSTLRLDVTAEELHALLTTGASPATSPTSGPLLDRFSRTFRIESAAPGGHGR